MRRTVLLESIPIHEDLEAGDLVVTFGLHGRFAGLVSFELVGVPSAAAAIADQSIRLTMARGGIGEAMDAHTETLDTIAEIDARADVICVVADLAPLLPGDDEAEPGEEAIAGQVCTLTISHPVGFVGSLRYLEARIRFETQ